MKSFQILMLGSALFCGVFSCGASLADDSSTAPPQLSATWQQHKYTFQFFGFTTTYSCDGLADKLKVLLIAAGARSDEKSTPGGCARGFGRPDKFAQAFLTFYTLAPVTEQSTQSSRVAAAWRAVRLVVHSPLDLAVGDCELVEQFHAHILPMFTTRNIDSQTTCIPHQDSGSTINLKFESLVPVKPVPKEKRSTSGHAGAVTAD
jgi:hypothetical protein